MNSLDEISRMCICRQAPVFAIAQFEQIFFLANFQRLREHGIVIWLDNEIGLLGILHFFVEKCWKRILLFV